MNSEGEKVRERKERRREECWKNMKELDKATDGDLGQEFVQIKWLRLPHLSIL